MAEAARRRPYRRLSPDARRVTARQAESGLDAGLTDVSARVVGGLSAVLARPS